MEAATGTCGGKLWSEKEKVRELCWREKCESLWAVFCVDIICCFG